MGPILAKYSSTSLVAFKSVITVNLTAGTCLNTGTLRGGAARGIDHLPFSNRSGSDTPWHGGGR